MSEKPRYIFVRPSTDLIARDLREYDPRDRRYLRKDRCFLCGVKLTPTTRTAEHVFPKWLLNRYGLWDHRISLLNRTEISYRQVRVPCCKRCNNVFLGALERRVRRAVEGGYEAFNDLPRPVIFQWLTKIYFQILYLEMRLAVDLSDPLRGTILTPEFLEQFQLEHMLLNSVRVPFRVALPPPWSIFVVPTQVSAVRERNFDFVDNLHNQVVAIRMGGVGVIAVLMDGHAQHQAMKDYFTILRRRLRLHPVQFRELAALGVYKRRTMIRTPKFVSVSPNQNREGMVMVLPGFSLRPTFGDWDQGEFARVLHYFVGDLTGHRFEEMFVPPNGVMSFLQDERNRPTHIDIEDNTRTTRKVVMSRR